MRSRPLLPMSAVSGISWPAIPSPAGALLLAIQLQFEQAERLPPERLEELAFRVLTPLLGHACRTVPHYGERSVYADTLAQGELDRDSWRSLPVLKRADVQEAGDALISTAVPRDHLPAFDFRTSGSTGRPIRGVGTAVTQAFWQAITLRDKLWHRRDVTAKLASIRAERAEVLPPEGTTQQGWGGATRAVFPPGPCARLSAIRDVPTQARWLQEQDPDYLLTLPSILVALARHCEANGTRLPKLREVSTYGETLGPDVRAACREAWGVEVIDMYSSQEIGYIALQCPESENLHVQSETVYVEIVDDDGRPCGPGEVGRVLCTALQNHAMPLFRYELGDYAEVGDACGCGRGLPVLRRVLGRQRNMLRLPSGARVWPRLPASQWAAIAPIRQLQLVQRELDHIDARMVMPRPLTEDEEQNFIALVHRFMGEGLRVTFSYVEEVDRAHDLKFEDFMSLV